MGENWDQNVEFSYLTNLPAKNQKIDEKKGGKHKKQQQKKQILTKLCFLLWGISGPKCGIFHTWQISQQKSKNWWGKHKKIQKSKFDKIKNCKKRPVKCSPPPIWGLQSSFWPLYPPPVYCTVWSIDFQTPPILWVIWWVQLFCRPYLVTQPQAPQTARQAQGGDSTWTPEKCDTKKTHKTQTNTKKASYWKILIKALGDEHFLNHFVDQRRKKWQKNN